MTRPSDPVPVNPPETGDEVARPETSNGNDRYIAWFADVSRADVRQVGGKGANLGELATAGLPVPPGFVVTAGAYLGALDRADARDELRRRVESLDVDDAGALGAAAEDCQAIVRRAGMPHAVRRAIVGAYASLGCDDACRVRVAVRSSATAEDTASTSFAGMNETFTNVSGSDEVVDRVVECWASLWSPRVVAYRATQRLGDEPAIAVVVQRMVDAHTSGVIFTADPATGDRDRLVIEAAYGLGEVVVGGQVEPDTYVVAKDRPHVVQEHIGTKATKVVLSPDGHDERVDVPAEDRIRRALDDDALIALARLAERIERHYGAPQDVEFAIDDERIWIVQSRPITTLGTGPAADEEPVGTLLVSGLGRRRASPPDRCAFCARPPRAAGWSPARCWWRR